MARSNIFPGNQEIVEVEEEFTAGPQYRSHQFLLPEMRREENDRRSLASNAGNISSLEEDLNQLFEIFNRRASSNGSSHQNQAGTSKRSASKKSLKAGGAYSPAPGTPERTNLKQALRGLCLSQASEMAAMKRSMKSPRSSEAGRIMAMYRNVVVEDSISNHSQDDNGGGVLEISPLPELSTFDLFQNVSEKLPSPDLWPSSQISLPEKTVGPTTLQNDGGFKSMYSGDQPLKPEKPENGTYFSPSQSQKNCMQQVSKCSMIENGKPSPSVDHAGLTESSEVGNHASPSSPSRSSYGQSSLDPYRACSAQSNSVAETLDVGTHNLKIYMLNLEKNTPPRSCSDDSRDKALEHNKSSMTQKVQLIGTAHKDNHEPSCSPHSSCDLDVNIKTGQKEIISVPPMVGDQRKIDIAHKKSLKAILSTDSAGDEKVSRSTRKAYHSVKPLVKTKSFVKRRSKKKMASDNSSKSIHGEFNNDMYSTLNPIVCPNCQCNMTAAWNDSNIGSSLSAPESVTFYQDSPISPFASLSGDVSSGNVIFDFNTPELSSDGLSKSKSVLVESSSNSKSRNKEEFTQSSKSVSDQCSTSTSVSEGSNMSRLSFCDRPHMSKDVRWEAIRHVKLDHGTLGLNNFSLLKKLGCGDIGTVYLAELIGTDCLFAIKVMDNDFLARRKKITRAKTEKEILRMLDHPFLPTLYCQFTSDNLSCLVMEYCPGGDLHVLRQRQPGRCFTEQAARFYVAEVLLALEYLHMLGVVYRDLKPENILVREDGHIMLSDFDLSLRCAVSPTLLVSSSVSEGSKRTSRDSRPCVDSLCIEPSCQVTCFTPRLLASSKSRKTKPDVAAEMRTLLQLVAEPTAARSNSFVGTHEYLSPEIIKGEGHGSAVDWWTFGIFLYELLYGKTPFKGPGNEETMANVVLRNLRFPDSPLVSLQARDLIGALLVKEPENRLGTERGATEIKQHPFFDGLNWALIRCAVPPELPESQGYGMPKPVPHEKKEKYVECSSGSGSAEHLEFEVF